MLQGENKELGRISTAIVVIISILLVAGGGYYAYQRHVDQQQKATMLQEAKEREAADAQIYQQQLPK